MIQYHNNNLFGLNYQKKRKNGLSRLVAPVKSLTEREKEREKQRKRLTKIPIQPII